MNWKNPSVYRITLLAKWVNLFTKAENIESLYQADDLRFPITICIIYYFTDIFVYCSHRRREEEYRQVCNMIEGLSSTVLMTDIEYWTSQEPVSGGSKEENVLTQSWKCDIEDNSRTLTTDLMMGSSWKM